MGQTYKEVDESKTKTLKFSTKISQHDLENKKRQANKFLTKVDVVKFEVSVNPYDPQDVQKGRMILSNLAEELKESASV